MNYIQCKHCGGLYCLDRVDSDYCDWCGSEFDTSEIIYDKKYAENNKKLGKRLGVKRYKAEECNVE